MIADPAFRGTSGGIVLHPISHENFHMVVVHADGQADHERPLGSFESFAKFIV